MRGNLGRRGLSGLQSAPRALGRMRHLGQTSVMDFNQYTWNEYQKVAAQQMVTSVQNAPPYLHPDLTFFLPPADSQPLIETTKVFVDYPAVGAAAVTVLSYSPPTGQIAVINKLAIINQGGSPPDGQGNVVWNVTVNGAAAGDGLNNLTAQVGTFANPLEIQILLIEGDVLLVTVQVNVAPQPSGTTAAEIIGWKYPISEALLPQLAQ